MRLFNGASVESESGTRTQARQHFDRLRTLVGWVGVAACAAVGLSVLRTPAADAQCFEQQTNASDSAVGDQFGYSVAMSGNVCIVGSRLDDTTFANTGSAYVYRFDAASGMWNFEGKLVASDPAAGDEFGYAVSIHSDAITGDTAVVGARFDDDKGSDAGSAYVFKFDGMLWKQVAKLKASDGAAGDRFGAAVAVAGKFVLVGARENNAPATNTGAVYAYKQGKTAWNQTAKLVPSDVAANDQFGFSVAIALTDGGEGAVGIVGSWHDDAPTSNSGSAYIYRYKVKNSAWSMSKKLVASDTATSDEFGFSVAISATPNEEWVVVGARNDDDFGSNSGSAYLYKRVDDAWPQQTKLTNDAGAVDDQFGSSVAIGPNAETVLVGMPFNNQGGADAGAACAFWKTAGNWQPSGEMIASDALSGQQFGAAVALAGDHALVGAYLNAQAGSDSGAIYYFKGASGFDANGNGAPDACEVPGDITGDGLVNTDDLAEVIATWGVCPIGSPCPADVSGNGVVDVDDLLMILSNWSK